MSRSIVIGLDSVDLKLAERWISQGLLPCLARLFADGPLVSLNTPSRALQGSVWPSLLTGVSPGRHGLYLQTQLRNGTYKLTNTYADHVQFRNFYEYLNDAGIRCGLADIPGDRTSRGLNGIQVVDWSTEFRYWRYQTVPRWFSWKLRLGFGRNPMTRHYNSGDSQPEHLALLRKLFESIRLKKELGRYLISRRDLDIVAFVFGEPHKAGHWLWKYHDHEHPDHEACPVELRDGLLDVYRKLDSALAKLIAEIDPQDNLIVFSDHGMQPAYRGDHLIDPILHRLGLLEYRTSPSRSSVEAAEQTPTGVRRLYHATRATAKQQLPQRLTRALERESDSFPQLDWAKTAAFSLPTDRHSYVRLNLSGREPRGVVAPEDYQNQLDELEVVMKSLINTSTNRPAVDEVFQIRRDFSGSRQDDLPDMSIRWSADAPLSEVYSPLLGTISGSIRELRSGNHREEGFLLARGPAFKEKPARHLGDILQIAPTILFLHDIQTPCHFEMPPLEMILK